MAVKFPYISAFICERVLQEADGVFSALRIADIFYVPEGVPEGATVQFFAVISLKVAPAPKGDIQIAVTFINASGERERLPDPGVPTPPSARLPDDPRIPGGVTLVMQLNIKPKNMGTC